VERIPVDLTKPIFVSLLDAGDTIISAGASPGVVAELAFELLERHQEEERWAIAQQTLGSSNSPTTATCVVDALKDRYVARQVARPAATQAVLDILGTATARMQTLASNGDLATAPYLMEMLFIWRDLIGPPEPRRWVVEMIGNDSGLADFLAGMLPPIGPTSGYRVSPKTVAEFTDADDVARRSRLIAPANERQKNAIEQYLREYDLIREGIDPDGPRRVLRSA
jgi:hypothetical protein